MNVVAKSPHLPRDVANKESSRRLGMELGILSVSTRPESRKYLKRIYKNMSLLSFFI